MPKNLVDAGGNVYSVADEDVPAALEQGLRLESIGEESDRAVEQAREERYGGIGGKAVALGAGVLRGATLGLSDVVLTGIYGDQGQRELDALRDVNPGSSVIGEVGGALATAIPSGGTSLLGKLPGGVAARAAAQAGERIGAGGLGRRIAGTAVQGAIEGAAQGGGHYLTSVALEDKPLSAEAFLADVGTGALFGGALGGGLGVAEHTLTRAKGLFPRGQVTREAADELERSATTQITSAMDDGAAMERTARQQLDEIRLEHARARTEVDRQLAELKLAEQRARVATQEAKAARAANPPPRKTRKAMKGEAEPPPPTPEPAPPIEAPPQAAAPGPAVADDTTAQIDRVETARAEGTGGREMEIRTWRAGAAEPEVRRVPRAELEKSLLDQLPENFKLGAYAKPHLPLKIGRGIPTTAEPNAFYVVKPSELAQRGLLGNEIRPDAISSLRKLGPGDRVEPIELNLMKDGRLGIEEGNHRLLRFAEAGDKPVLVMFRNVDAAPTAAFDVSPRVLQAIPAKPTGGGALMDQLTATKSALDDGAELGALSRQADEVLAAGDPRAATIVDAVKRERMTRDEVQAWIKGRRAGGEQNAADRGYRVSHDNPALTRSRISTPVAGETDAAKREAMRILGKVAPEERLAADQAVARMFTKPAAPPALDDQIGQVLGKKVGEHADLGADLAEGAQKIAAHEAAAADLAEALGAKAPAAARERATAYRAATAAKSESDAAATAATADAIKTKLEPGIAAATGKAVDEGLLSKLADLGAGLEVLKAMGVPVPDASKIPVIGPVLSAFLKARAALSVFRRGGGSVPKTSEAVIAGKAAASRDRVSAAVRGALEVGSRAASKAQRASGAAAALGVSLFPGPDRKKDAKATPVELYRARMEELARAQQPGAVASVVRERVPTSDVMLQQEIAGALERKLAFLSSKAPRPAVMPTLLKGDGEWTPPRQTLEAFARYVDAANNPIAVLEDAAAGHAVTIEAAETLRACYPRLFQEAQMTLLERAQHMQETLPYARRLMLSVLFQVPVDGSMSPGHIRFLQQAAQPAPAPAQGSPAMGAPPTPSVSGAVSLGDRTMTSLDRRAGA
jgi:hypothetical protein